MAFWKRNLALFKLAVVTNLEYRFNYFIDSIVQPLLGVAVELLLWTAIFAALDTASVGGFSKESYLAYALWGPFFSRIAVSWMYEARMIEEVNSGSINSILARPISFFEYYLSQLMGYKVVTTFISTVIPIVASIYFDLPFHWERLPLAFLLVFYYLIIVHQMSFIVSCCAFFFNRIHSFTVAKNLFIFLLVGELVPIDLMPDWLEKIMLTLPFSSGVFIPVAYIVGRVDIQTVVNGFASVTCGIIFFGVICVWLWNKGLRAYVGTGA